MTQLNPAPLIELATAYWHSAVLIAAVRLDVFSHLAEGPLTADALAERAGLEPRAAESLLAALTSLELTALTPDHRFENGALAAAFLVKGRPGYLGPALLYNGDVYPRWGELDAVIKSGAVRRPPEAYLGDDLQQTRNFVYGMHHRALGVGQAVASVIDLSGRARLADVGGGPGTYSALLTARFPELTAEVLDLPGVVAVSREIMATMGAGRVRCEAFDYYQDALPGRYDAALISGVLHREQPEQAKALLAKTAAALEGDAVLYLSDVMLDDTRTGPRFATLFALNMRVLAHDGRCHSVAEQRAWLAELGFEVTAVHTLPAPIHYTVIRAERRL